MFQHTPPLRAYPVIYCFDSHIFPCLLILQAEWREEVKKHFEKIKSEGTCIHRLDEELIRRRRDELRSVSRHKQADSHAGLFLESGEAG